jgi:hypothetical protein
MGRTVVPIWFAVAGIALGVGGVLRDEPLAGACGAVAGVTMGLLQQRRARVYRRHNLALRRRLKQMRAASAKSAEQVEQLEQQVSTLKAELWQQRMLTMLMDPSTALTGGIPVMEAPSPGEQTASEQPPAPEQPTVAEIDPPVETPAEGGNEAEPVAEAEAGGSAVDASLPEDIDQSGPAGADTPDDAAEPGSRAGDGAAPSEDPGAEVIDLPQKAKEKAKRSAAQAG